MLRVQAWKEIFNSYAKQHSALFFFFFFYRHDKGSLTNALLVMFFPLEQGGKF
jgi:hypothetical protein